MDEMVAAAETGLDYPLFMAVAEKVGHDKRGNVIYRRTPDGEDALVRRLERIKEIDPQTDTEVLREIEVTERQVDDELPEVAAAYLHWLREQA
jgi:type I restriction enzyme M protein